MINQTKIFVVEDDDILRFGIQTLLKRAGFKEVIAAKSLKESRQILEKEKPNIAVLDIVLEGQNEGFIIAKELTKRDIPFIFLTGSTASEIIKEAISLNPIAYLVKPVNTDELIANINLFFHTSKKDIDKNSTIFVKSVQGCVSLIIEDIMYVTSQNVYIDIYMQSGKKIVVRSYLSDFLSKLKSPEILKVHRSFVVNTKAITRVENSAIYIEDVEIPVSKTYKNKLFELLSIA